MVNIDTHRQLVAARLSPAGDVLTFLYADGGSPSTTPVDPAVAAQLVKGLGLVPGGISGDGVRHWWT